MTTGHDVGLRAPEAGATAPAPRLDLPTMSLVLPTRGTEVVIGVSVLIPEPWGTELVDWRASFGDPLAASVPPHVTLLPPTTVDRGHLDDIRAHLGRVARRLTPFPLRLEGTGTFRPVSPVVFVRLVQGAGGCDRMQRLVRTGPLVRELSFPYHPHVTVAHHVPEDSLDRAMTTLAGFSAQFTVGEFGLFEQGADGVWRQQHVFPFGAGEI